MRRRRQNAVRETIAAHYDGLDWFYRRVWGEHVHHGLWRTGRETPAQAVHALVHRVAAEARVGPGSRVCDVGCGYGATARLLAREYGAQVVGLTISAVQQAHAQRAIADDACADQVEIRLEDWQQNRLPASSFDAVIAIECISHIADKPRFLEQVRRVLRPGGRAVVCAWLTVDEPPAWQRKVLLDPIHRDGQLAGMITEAGGRTLIRQADLRLVRFDDLTAHVRRTWPCVARRFLRVMVSDLEAWRQLWMQPRRHRRFALAAIRIWLAYRLGCMRYGLFVTEVDPAPRPPA